MLEYSSKLFLPNSFVFGAGQLVCNLTPTTESEIFYRRALSTVDDPPNLRLTVMTEDAVLTDSASQGGSSLGEQSVIYDLDASSSPDLNGSSALTGAFSLELITDPPTAEFRQVARDFGEFWCWLVCRKRSRRPRAGVLNFRTFSLHSATPGRRSHA